MKQHPLNPDDDGNEIRGPAGAALSVTFDYALEAMSFSGTSNINNVAGCKDINFDFFSYFVFS